MHIAHCTKFEVVVAFRFFFLADVINNANAFLPGGGLLMCGCSDDFDTIGVVTGFSNKEVVVFQMSHHERLNEKRELLSSITFVVLHGRAIAMNTQRQLFSSCFAALFHP